MEKYQIWIFTEICLHVNIYKLVSRLLLISIFYFTGVIAMAFLLNKTLSINEFSDLIEEATRKKDAHIDDIEIKGFEIPVKIIRDITFSNSVWNDVTMTGQHHLENIVFENCVINNSDFTGVNLKNIRFKKCKIHNVIFNKAQFDKIIFEESEIDSTDTNIDHSYREMIGGEIYFNNSKIKSINFFHGKMKAYFNNSEMNDIKALGLKEGSLLSIVNTNAFLIDFSRSIFESLIVKNSTIKESKANNCRIGSVILEDSDLDFPIGDGKEYGTVTARNTKNVVIGGTPVKEVMISNCGKSNDVYVAGMVFDKMVIDGCSPSEFLFYKSKGKLMSISNVETAEFDFRHAEVQHLILKKIHIRSKLLYDNAKVEKLETHNISFGENIKIKSEGANIEIKPDIIKATQ